MYVRGIPPPVGGKGGRTDGNAVRRVGAQQRDGGLGGGLVDVGEECLA
jgi:hypothetical protein